MLPGDVGRVDRRPGSDRAGGQRPEPDAARRRGRRRGRGNSDIYPVRTVNEGIDTLTDPGGRASPAPDGAYPPDSINGRIEGRLRELAEKNKENNGNNRKNGKGPRKRSLRRAQT